MYQPTITRCNALRTTGETPEKLPTWGSFFSTGSGLLLCSERIVMNKLYIILGDEKECPGRMDSNQ